MHEGKNTGIMIALKKNLLQKGYFPPHGWLTLPLAAATGAHGTGAPRAASRRAPSAPRPWRASVAASAWPSPCRASAAAAAAPGVSSRVANKNQLPPAERVV